MTKSFPARAGMAAALLATALATGCGTPTPEQAEKRCESMRKAAAGRPYDDVLQACIQQMGEPSCKKCLDR